MTMAKLIITIFCVLFELNVYPATLVVTNVDYENYKIEFENATGYHYEVDEYPEDYQVGDVVSAIMYGNQTPEITDDVIVTCRYSGFVIDELR